MCACWLPARRRGHGQTRLQCNRLRGRRVVASDHDHPNARIARLRHRLGDFAAQWVGQTQQADKFKLKIVLDGGPVHAFKT